VKRGARSAKRVTSISEQPPACIVEDEASSVTQRINGRKKIMMKQNQFRFQNLEIWQHVATLSPKFFQLAIILIIAVFFDLPNNCEAQC